MINKTFIKLLYICCFLFICMFVQAQTQTKKFDLPELNVINKENIFLSGIDSLILDSDCARLNKMKFNNYSMNISQKNDSVFSITVVLTVNIRDSITDMGFFKRKKSLFIVRGINPNNLFFVTKKNRTWMYKKQTKEKINELTLREMIEGPPPVWYLEYYNEKLILIKIDNCIKNEKVKEDFYKEIYEEEQGLFRKE